MNYTRADAFAVDATTGHHKHQDTAPVPTAVTAEDLNMVIWSLMKVIEAAGVAPAYFDPANPATYNRLQLAIQAMTGAVLSTGGVPDGLKIGPLTLQFGYLAATNVTAAFPHAFTTACLAVFASNADAQGANVDNAFAYPVDAATFHIATKTPGGAISGYPCFWLAIGW